MSDSQSDHSRMSSVSCSNCKYLQERIEKAEAEREEALNDAHAFSVQLDEEMLECKRLRERAESAEAEREQWHLKACRLTDEYTDLLTRAESAEASLRQLRDYARHSEDCELVDPRDERFSRYYVNLPDGSQREAACTCGFASLLVSDHAVDTDLGASLQQITEERSRIVVAAFNEGFALGDERIMPLERAWHASHTKQQLSVPPKVTEEGK